MTEETESELADLAYDAIQQVQRHVDAESVGEAKLEDLRKRWLRYRKEHHRGETGAVLDKEGKPTDQGWYLDTMGEDPRPVYVFKAGGQHWVYSPLEREVEILSVDWVPKLLKIGGLPEGGFPL